MSQLLGRIRTLILGHANDLITRAEDMNSLPVLRQSVRDLEDAISQAHEQAVVQAGSVRTLNRQISETESQLAKEKILVTSILASSNANKDVVARAHATTIKSLQDRLTSLQSDVEGQTAASAKLDAAVAQMDNKHTTLVNRIRELERIDSLTRAKEQTAKAFDQFKQFDASQIDQGIDNMTDRMMKRKDVADERFDRAVSSVTPTEDPTQSADIDQILNDLAPKTKEQTAKSAT